MRKLVHPLLLLVAQATDRELARYVEYLKAENDILRSKLPKRVGVTLAERQRLLKLGRRVGPAIRELISIVTPRTFYRWAAGEFGQRRRRPPGRPRRPEETRQLILEMAKDSGWGYKRILGELRKLGVRNISRSTIARVLQENGFEPGPKRGQGTWRDFVQRHLTTLWATDFFTKDVWTLRGRTTYYVLFFIHIHTRRVFLIGMTPKPDGAWMAQQARNLSMVFADEAEHFRPTHIVCDRDAKFTQQFCSILEDDGVQFRKIAPRSPNMNPFAESWIQRTKHEALNHFIAFGERHLRHILSEWLHYYHTQRPHQGLGNVLISKAATTPSEQEELSVDQIVCYKRLWWTTEMLRKTGGIATWPVSAPVQI